MPGDVTFNGPALALASSIILALAGFIGVLFWQLIGAKDAAVKREQDTVTRLTTMLDRLIPAVEDQARQIQRLVTLIETWRPGRKE